MSYGYQSILNMMQKRTRFIVDFPCNVWLSQSPNWSFFVCIWCKYKGRPCLSRGVTFSKKCNEMEDVWQHLTIMVHLLISMHFSHEIMSECDDEMRSATCLLEKYNKMTFPIVEVANLSTKRDGHNQIEEKKCFHH